MGICRHWKQRNKNIGMLKGGIFLTATHTHKLNIKMGPQENKYEF